MVVYEAIRHVIDITPR